MTVGDSRRPRGDSGRARVSFRYPDMVGKETHHGRSYAVFSQGTGRSTRRPAQSHDGAVTTTVATNQAVAQG